MSKKRTAAVLLLIFIAVPLCVCVGSFLLKDRRYMLISAAAAAISCGVLYLSFEKGSRSAHKLVLIASMTALSVAGRFVFAPVPFFKPVTALVIICGACMGSEAGFLCGSLSAFLSNFLFMQGPWTPYQMFIWGSIGFFAGVFSNKLKSSRIFLIVFGAVSGVLYSAFMDIWTTVWWDGRFVLSRYTAAVAAAVPITVIYAVSNVFFLLILMRPISEKLDRISKKYGI